ncbi:MAG TPA: 4-vinyl reductase [archaeon]|jgi:predicted hydrocarbon binding protein|nr:4-vinyl reductase [archaeon]
MLNSFFDKFIFTSTLKYTHNNFYLIDIPFFIAPTETLTSICEVQDNEFHKKIYESVKKSTLENLMKEFGANIGSEKKKQLDFFQNFFTASGWGKIQLIDLQPEGKKAIIILENSPFASKLKGKTQLPADVFLRGTFAGIFSKIFEENIDCVESECAALNGEKCKFIIKPKTEFDFANKIVQDQLSQE